MLDVVLAEIASSSGSSGWIFAAEGRRPWRVTLRAEVARSSLRAWGGATPEREVSRV